MSSVNDKVNNALEFDFSRAFTEHQKALVSVNSQLDKVQLAANVWVKSLKNGGKILWFGNGGSAADAQHMAAELMVRYVKNRQPLASIALNTDTSILTAHSNDFDFESVFARQIQALAATGDIVMALSTSGNSENVIQGALAAKEKGCFIIAMTGRKASRLGGIADLVFQIDSDETARIQEAHSFISHLLCQAIDDVFA